jgi:long-chain acyl-CoA synthetase
MSTPIPTTSMRTERYDPARRSVGGVVRTQAGARPDAVALRFVDRTITWAEHYERAKRAASAMIASGVRSQDHVAFLDKNGVEFFELLYGCGLANAINVSVNWRLAAPEILYTLNDAEAKVLVVGPDFFDTIELIEKDLTTVTKIVAIGDHPRWESFDDWLSGAPAEDPHVPTAYLDCAIQLYTSGTTGLPKGVMLSNKNLFTLLDEVAEPWGFGLGETNLVCMPLFHIGGAGWAIAGMYNGCTSVLVREFVPSVVLDTLVSEGVTTALFVPAMLGFLSMVPGAADRTYPIKRIVYGASPITNETLLAAMRTFKCEFFQVYGMTETTGGFTQLDSRDHDPNGPRAHLLRSAGKAFPWVEMKIMDLEKETECAPGEVGEVWTRSDQNMTGYWAKPEETAKTLLPDGWLRTGDAGYMDEDGFLFLTDRVKDMIVSGGENVYPAEVENAIASHPAVGEVGVIGVPSERWGETVMAIVVRRAGMEVTAPEIIVFAKERLASYKCPTSVDFIDALPRNPSGKVLKKDLREPFWAGHARRVN